jgi:hypothetical protein
MRRTAPRIASAALPVIVVAAAAAWASSPAYAFTLKATEEHEVLIVPKLPGQAGLTWGYWGKLNKPNVNDPTGPKWGSYRATCVWSADSTSDDRFLCVVVLSHGPPSGGSLTVQGLIHRPSPNTALFGHASQRLLPITGGTGPYATHDSGYLSLRSAPGAIGVFNS